MSVRRPDERGRGPCGDEGDTAPSGRSEDLEPGLLALELDPVELGVVAAWGQQLVVAAPLDDAAVVEHQDDVGLPDGGQAVGDDQRGATPRAVARACCTAASDSESRWAVASSSTTTSGAFSRIRAMAMRCFSPPDSR